jgi:hypothetical protein
MMDRWRTHYNTIRPHSSLRGQRSPKNDFNLNIPRYIDSTEPEDLQDIDRHLRGGISRPRHRRA